MLANPRIKFIMIEEKIRQTLEEYSKTPEAKRLPEIRCCTIQDGGGEGYVASRSRGVVEFEAESPLAAAYAVNQLTLASRSGHLAEFLGRRKPHHALRPIWITDMTTFQHEDYERLIAFGYNAVILDADMEATSSFQDSGLKRIVKVASLEALPCEADYIFWESQCLDPEFENRPNTGHFLQADFMVAEVREVEQALRGTCPLIYYVPTSDTETAEKQCRWLSDFCDEVGPYTTVAFSAVAGPPWEDQYPAHPFWEVLRCCPDVSGTPLMPILYAGGSKQVPLLTLDLFDKFLTRCYRHHFGGVVSVCDRFPQKGEMHECSLWATAQALWNGRSSHLLAETWMSANGGNHR